MQGDGRQHPGKKPKKLQKKQQLFSDQSEATGIQTEAQHALPQPEWDLPGKAEHREHLATTASREESCSAGRGEADGLWGPSLPLAFLGDIYIDINNTDQKEERRGKTPQLWIIFGFKSQL